MRDTLAGTVTFLFTDIEGSTQLWEQHSASMHAALARHDALLRQAIESHHGQVFKTVGDAFYAVFPAALDAVAAATAAQRTLRNELPQIRVRMAIHTGDAEAREGDYFGPALNRVARLLAAGHGGQVLLSQATVERLLPGGRASSGSGPRARARARNTFDYEQEHEYEPGRIRVRGLGEHRLRDLPCREAIYQWVQPGLPSEFPPLNTLDVAFRRGAVRAAAIAAIIVAVVTSLAIVAVTQAHRAELQRREARRNLYAAQMDLAEQALEAGNLDHAQELLDRQRPGPGDEDLRGFAWRYLQRRCQRGDERFTLPRHEEKVNAVAISPDGHLLATGDGKAVRLWDLASHGCVDTLPQGDAISAVAFSPDGRFLATGTSSGPVNLWVRQAAGRWAAVGPSDTARTSLGARSVQPTAWKRIATLPGEKLLNGGLAFSPDGELLAAGSGPRVNVWDVADRRRIAALRGRNPDAQATAVTFSPDGRMLAYAFEGDPTTVHLWEAASRRPLASLVGHSGFVFSAAFSPDGKTFASGSGDTTVRLWDVATGRTVRILKGLANGVAALAFSPNGKRLATGGGDGLIKLWDVASGQPVDLLKSHRGAVNVVAFAPDGRMLASGSDDQTVKLWSATRPPDPDVLRGHTAWVWHMAFSRDSKILASAGGLDGTVKLWDVATGRMLRSRDVKTGGVACVAFSPDGRYLACSGVPPAVELWDVPLEHRIGLLAGHTRGVTYVTFSPDGRFLASGSRDQTVRLWDIASRAEVARLPGPLDFDINSTLAFSPDGKSLAVMGAKSGLLWDLTSRRATPIFPGCPAADAVAFSLDGRTLVAGGEDGRLRWWDIIARRVTDVVPGHAGGVPGLVFSPDGREMATVGFDNTVRIWDTRIRQEVLALKGHDAPPHCVAFSPDGNTLATAGADSTVRLWRAAPLAGMRTPVSPPASQGLEPPVYTYKPR